MRSKPLEYQDDHYTLFHKVNTNVFLPNGKIGDLSNQHMPQGTLPQALNMQISIDQKDNITLTWTNHLEYIASYDNSRLGIIVPAFRNLARKGICIRFIYCTRHYCGAKFSWVVDIR